GHGGAWAHGTDHHDRLVGLLHQVEEVGGLFQGVGAVGDDDAIDVLAVGQFGDAFAQLQQVFVADAFGGDLHHLLAAHVGQVGQLRHTGDELVDAELGGLVGGAVGGAGACTGDGAAGGEDHHVGQFLLLL